MYLAADLPIGSGIVEASCKNIVGRRMKCTRLRWSVVGTNPVLWLRCAWLKRLARRLLERPRRQTRRMKDAVSNQ